MTIRLRARSLRYKFTMRCKTRTLPKARKLKFYSAATFSARIVGERVVAGWYDRREVTVSDPFRPREFGDVVGGRAQRQIIDLARLGRDVGRRGVHQITVEHQRSLIRWRRLRRLLGAILGNGRQNATGLKRRLPVTRGAAI